MNTKCTKCGTEHNNNFCPNCGAPAALKNKSLSAGGIIAVVFLSIFGVLVFVVLLFASLDPKTSTPAVKTTSIAESDRKDTELVEEDSEPEELLFKPGNVITSDNMEVKINSVEFSYDVVPDNTDFFYIHHEADDGEVYIHIDTDVKNLSKMDLDCNEILAIKADYDNGFVYRGFTTVEDSSTGFTYANITSIDPLKTAGVHFLISCPEEVVDSGKPLYVEMKLDGTSEVYKYIIR